MMLQLETPPQQTAHRVARDGTEVKLVRSQLDPEST